MKLNDKRYLDKLNFFCYRFNSSKNRINNPHRQIETRFYIDYNEQRALGYYTSIYLIKDHDIPVPLKGNKNE